MTRKRRFGTMAALWTMTMVTVLALATPAGAVMTGPCSGSATFSNGTVVDGAQPLSVISVIPEKDDVSYSGQIDIAPPDDEIPFSGSMQARVAGLMNIPLASWSGETEDVSAAGVYTYEAPGWVPRGTGEINVVGTHDHNGTVCSVSVNMTLEGSPGAIAIIAATGTALFFAGVVAAGVKKTGVGP